ncbi:hypothetical protein BDR07DRAFT_1406589, partial [Suillus spraguei]
MTIISNDPTWWPLINASILYSYFIVASFIVVTYDWGEHDNIQGLLAAISYRYFQYLHLDK